MTMSQILTRPMGLAIIGTAASMVDQAKAAGFQVGRSSSKDMKIPN